MSSVKVVIKPKVWPWLWRALLDWLVILVSFYAFYRYPHPIVFIISLLIIGTRQHALSILGHDGGHRLISRNRFINDALAGVLGLWPLGTPLDGYRRFHFMHHRNVGTPDDPELIHKKLIPQWKLPFRSLKVTSHLIMDFLGGAVPHVGLIIYLTQPVAFRDTLGPLIMNLSFILVCIYFETWWILALWYGAIFTSFWAVFRMRVWTEHVGTEATHIISATWWQKLIFLPHNTWCHHEHHENTAVPCWALASLRDPQKEMDVASLFRKLSQKH